MILNLKDESSWEGIVRNILNKILEPSYVRIVAENADEIKYQDNEEEACNLFAHKISRKKLTKGVMREVSRNFTDVIAYHACRVDQVATYYENGIIPLSPIDTQSTFRNQFKSYASQEEIEKAIAEVSTKTRAGVTHVVLDDRVFYKFSGHYLIYGSEYFQCLAVRLPGDEQTLRDMLKENGRATVFVCKLPFSLISNLERLVQFMLADHFFRIAHTSDEVGIFDYTITITGHIKREFIIDDYRPTKILDPFCDCVWNDERMNYE